MAAALNKIILTTSSEPFLIKVGERKAVSYAYLKHFVFGISYDIAAIPLER